MQAIHISTDKNLLNLALIHEYLSMQSYWARGIPLERVQRSVDNSLCFGAYTDGQQVAFARIVTDYSTVAYLGDVFVVEAYRGKGVSKQLMEYIAQYPALQGLRRWLLATADAHGLYAQYGFSPLAAPERWMEKHNPNVYNLNNEY